MVGILRHILIALILVGIWLEWTPNQEGDLEGYRVYWRVGSSGDRVLSNYNGKGLIHNGQSVDSGFRILLGDIPGHSTRGRVKIALDGLSDFELYYFVITAYDTVNLESDASDQVFTFTYRPNVSLE